MTTVDHKCAGDDCQRCEDLRGERDANRNPVEKERDYDRGRDWNWPIGSRY